jgi:hypothetical protein
MSSTGRYPPPARDRSPPRYDRRPPPSTSSLPGASQRDPPRGPKADFRATGSFASNPAPRGRGAGFSGRASDTWDRDRDRDRDVRPAPQSYRGRDDDRPEWSRRDRDFLPGDRSAPSTRDVRPYAGRERSASPIRARRDSRESLPSTFSRLPESSSTYYAPAGRGSLTRGRGRGDWDRGRGRNSFVGERDRDLFHPRSRSRESWRDRDFDRGRPLPGDSDRPGGFERRGYDRSRERDARPRDSRDHDIWQRSPSPSRGPPHSLAGSNLTPSATTSDRPGKADLDIGRRTSVVATPTSALRDSRGDGDPADYFGGSRLESSRRDAPQPPQPAPAAIGLDYGPPPSLPPTTTPSTEKPPANVKPPTPKPEPVAASTSSFQPPSGPKAGRTGTSTLGQPAKAPAHQDTWTRSDSFSRPNRPNLTPTAGPSPTEAAVVRKDAGSLETKPPIPADRSMPPNVPSGPRASTAQPYKQPPTPTPREAPKPLDSISPAIPKGPRLDREAPRPANVWLNNRAGHAPTGPRQQNAFPAQAQKPRGLHAFGSPVPTAPSGPKALIATSPRLQEAKMTLLPPRRPEMQSSEDVDMSTSASSGDEDEPEDDSFDEEYYAESEERHKQEMRMLEARKPPPLLEDPTTVALLFKLQFLEMISRETGAPPTLTEPVITKEEISTTTTVPTHLPSSDVEPRDLSSKQGPEPSDDKRRPLKEPLVNPIPTPPIESLPYLGPRFDERITFEESDDEIEHEAVATLLQQEFEREAWDARAELEEMRADFKLKYPGWKHEIYQIERERREQQVSPAPASPAPSVAPSVTPSLTHERTRGARNTTEADLEAVLLLSKQSLKEEEERREREAAASSEPNYDMEACIPSMMTSNEIERCQFEDTNNLIPRGQVKHVFGFWPPKDDFTDDEQAQFITAYCQNPKKWGKIAESLPDRTYQDCIVHYYLTKEETRYKDIFKRSQPRKRGRGKAANKPRSTALMSELLRGEEGDGTPVAVTDSGRPRRAAAPTFGDAPSEADPSTPIPQAKKLASAASGADPTVPKTKGRKTGSGTKTRRTKAQMQADQQALLLGAAEASPGKTTTNAKSDRGRSILRNVDVLPAKTDLLTAAQPPRLIDPVAPPYPAADIPTIPPIPATTTATTAAVTSYWSVPEQHKFPELLRYFGRDFAAIADFMKTKSVTMVRFPALSTRRESDPFCPDQKLLSSSAQ